MKINWKTVGTIIGTIAGAMFGGILSYLLYDHCDLSDEVNILRNATMGTFEECDKNFDAISDTFKRHGFEEWVDDEVSENEVE